MKKSKCVITQIHNERIFFPAWLKYYSQFFEPQDIFVLHLIKPKRVPFDDWLETQAGFVRLPTIDEQHCNFQLVVDRVNNLISNLLGNYHKVLFCEVDEFITHHNGLGKFIDKFTGHVARTTGFNVIHDYKNEESIDFDKPILRQRSHWIPDELYNKPLLVNDYNIKYLWGFHRCSGLYEHMAADPNLILIHLRMVDYHLGVNRNLERQKNEPDSELAKNHQRGTAGWQHYLDSFEMRALYDRDLSESVLIPEAMRDLV